MGRLNSPLVHHSSPLAPKAHKHTRFATRLAQHQKPLFLANPRPPRSPAVRSRLHSTNTNRFLQSRTHLSAIREDPEEGEGGPLFADAPGTRPHTHTVWENARPGPSQSRQVDHDADASAWDDESTLVAMLQEDSQDKDEDDQMLELVEQLKAPMAAQGAMLKQFLADTVLPAYSHIKDVHGVLEEKVDLEFGAGLLTFDEVCKKVERIALKDEDEIKTAHARSQRIIAKTLTELEEAYELRKGLWSAFQEELNHHAARANAALDALPGDVEQTIALLEKKSKVMEKDASATANQKTLRGLLEKL
ncbi:hypothetical protein BD413DRAFT_1266 [Trametes elegans]|nr:hypothetical protein BD413DRAFT_1266 [Trametes elegans]